MKVSCVCCTYGRFGYLKRSIAFWLNQDYCNKELIIFNTAPMPLVLDASIADLGIRIVNQVTQTKSAKPYMSLGMVRRDALAVATGDVYVCWDDDDLFLPWHVSQGMEHLTRCGRGAWMPAQSYYSMNGGETYELGRNNFEASVLVKMEFLKKYGFDADGRSGSEHRPWRRGMVRDRQLSEGDEVTPFESYAYVWGEPGHKISGTIDKPGNFEHHKTRSTDFGEGSCLTPESSDRVDWFYVNVYRSYPDPRLGDRINRYLKTTTIDAGGPGSVDQTVCGNRLKNH